MQQKLQQVGLPQDKFKGSKEYLLLVKVWQKIKTETLYNVLQ